MMQHLINETSSTSEESQQAPHVKAAASTESEGSAGARPGMLLASFVLLAALTTAGPSGAAPIGTYFRRRDEFAAAESSTTGVERDAELVKQVEKIFEQGASEFFQDGMYSEFSRSLMAILTQYGRAAFRAIAEYVFSGRGNADVISEALRWLADFDDPATLSQRWAILHRTLKNHSPLVRDGAILGFAALDDPRARSPLLERQNSEPIPELRRLIQQVVDQLNATHGDAAPQR